MVFNSVISSFCLEVSKSTQTPLDMSGGIILAVLASLLQRRYQAVVGPDHRECLAQYIAIGMDSGERKSPVHRMCCAPLWKLADDGRKSLHDRVAAAENQKKVLEEQIKKMRRAKVVNMADLSAKQAEFDAVDVPYPRQLSVDDVTVESLIRVLSQDPDGCAAIIQPEAGIFGLFDGRYADAAGANLEIFLKAHTGESYHSIRITREENFISSPKLTIGVAVQPIVLRDFMSNRKARERGLEARFHLALPKSKVGTRTARGEPVSEATHTGYARAISQLYEHVACDNDVIPMKFTAPAVELLDELHNELEPQLPNGRALAPIRPYASKLIGQAARFATILQAADDILCDAVPGGVDSRHAEKGIMLAKHFLEHRVRADSVLGGAPQSRARQILPWVLNQETFRARDCQRAHQTIFENAEETVAALEVLESRQFIRSREHQPERQGRPTIEYDVNPNGRRQNDGMTESGVAT